MLLNIIWRFVEFAKDLFGLLPSDSRYFTVEMIMDDLESKEDEAQSFVAA